MWDCGMDSSVSVQGWVAGFFKDGIFRPLHNKGLQVN